ncbi:MAG TPA: hypothetical protein PLP19_20265, partial [bacterium]|nr:hypothetical protein [bacterium]
MKILFTVLLVILVIFNSTSQAFDKSDYDITESQGLLKTTTTAISNYGSHLATTAKLEYSLITGGYFTIGTLSGSSTSTLDDNCGISFGHPYAMTSYPLLGIDGAWE